MADRRKSLADLIDIDDPASPDYHRRHGGPIVTGLIDSIRSGVTLPRDVYEGKVGDPMTDDAALSRVLDMAGAGSTGGLIAGKPAGALAAGLSRKEALAAKMGHNGGPEMAKFPELAERYPESGAHSPKFDKNKGEYYEGKDLTAEEAALMKERARIVKDMQANGYEGYFDPAQRFDADPAQYADQGRTVEQNLMKTEGKRAEYDARTSEDPAVLERLDKAYQDGSDLDMRNWYAMGQLEQEFIKELGPEEGRRQFQERFAGGMAATTAGMNPSGNLLAAHYGNYQRARGQPAAQKSYDLPSPLGGRYITGNMEQYDKMAAGGFQVPMDKNPKRYNFMQNFLGKKDRATIDEQMMGLIAPGGKKAPPQPAYGHYERPVHMLAEKYGISPREAQEVMWGGAKKGQKGEFEPVPMIQTVNDAIERTHRLTGMPKEEIVRRGLVRAEIPLYSQGRGAALGAMLADDEE